MNTPKEIIVTAVSEFGNIKSIKIQLIGMWQKTIVENCETWASKNQFRVLLFTLLVKTTTHNLGALLDGAGGKICSKSGLELDLVQCEKCGKFRHSSLEYNAPNVSVLSNPKSFRGNTFGIDQLQLTRLYAKKNILIFCPAAFVVSMASLIHSSVAGSGAGFFLSGAYILGGFFSPLSVGDFSLSAYLVSLECFLELLTNQVSGILCKLSNVELVSLASTGSAISDLGSVIDMVMDKSEMVAPFLFFVADKVPVLGPSSSKILTTKIGCLESKLVALEASIATCNVWGINVSAKQEDIVHWHKESGNVVSIIMEIKLRSNIRSWIANKFNGVKIFSMGLDKGFLGAEVAIIMNNNLAHYVCKIEEIPDWVILIWLLFKGKLSVSILDLYASASAGARFSQALEINAFITKTINSSTFLVIGGDFNQSGSRRSACFRFCSDLGLVNSLSGFSLIKAPTWSNSRGVEKTIDFVFISASLASMVTGCAVSSASEFFESDHKAVLVLINLDGLVDVNLNSLHKQANRDKWKFKIKSASDDQWLQFKKCFSMKDLSLHWDPVANCFVNAWSVVDFEEASKFCAMVDGSADYDAIFGHLSSIKKRYYRSKYFEFKNARDVVIRKTVDKCIENFCTDKGHMIKSVLKWPFHKVVFDHLVVNNDLVLEPGKVKSVVNTIIEGWTRKHAISDVLPACWTA
ncbi:hypothetical protein G9A89_017922 [Geosiphon pyriformis]|nr:hypothetical protein G9A89_017922 [Geosiphon pyriformis]